MNYNRTFIIMIVVAIVFMGISIFTFLNPAQQKQTRQIEEIKETEKTKEVKEVTDEKTVIKTAEYEYENITKAVKSESDIVYENKYYKIVFNQNDAVIKHAYIKKFYLNQENDPEIYDLVNGDENTGALELKIGQWNNNHSVEQLSGTNLYQFTQEKNRYVFQTVLKNKQTDEIIEIKKIFTFSDNENVFKLDIELSNNKNKAFNIDKSNIAYSLGWGPQIGETESNISNFKRKRQYDKLVYLKKDSKKEVTAYPKSFLFMKGDKASFQVLEKESDNYWIGAGSQYFVSMILPDDQKYNYFFDFNESEKNKYFYGLMRDTNKSQIKSSFYIYIGPKIGTYLKKYEKSDKNDFQLSNSKFEKMNDLILFGIGNGIGWILDKIVYLVKNYGIAIIILTIILKLLMAPLTHQSMVSQEKMSKVQPKLQALQEKYKDKPEILNREMMNLYKKEGINPLSGCLPLLLQMPLLMAMYELIDKMVMLKGSSFLWIKDLSMMDSVFNLGFAIPLVNISSINPLPIIMTLVSVISTMTMPDVKGNSQTKMMMWSMPLIFFFLFYNVSSGLVLYWTVMNILNLAQQLIIKNLKKKNIKTA